MFEFRRDDSGGLGVGGDGGVPVFFLAVDGHDDGAGGLGEGDGGIEDEAAAADLGDGVGLAVGVEADANLGGVAGR